MFKKKINLILYFYQLCIVKIYTVNIFLTSKIHKLIIDYDSFVESKRDRKFARRD